MTQYMHPELHSYIANDKQVNNPSITRCTKLTISRTRVGEDEFVSYFLGGQACQEIN